MNLFEAIAILCIAVGLVVGLWSSVDGGVWAAILGALRGAAIAYGWWVASMFLLLTVLSIGIRYRPPFPRCKRGSCREADYTYVYLADEATGRHKWLQDSTQGKLLRCRCGTLYLKDVRDHRFYEVLDDGSLVPYMRHTDFGRWQPDGGDDVESAT